MGPPLLFAYTFIVAVCFRLSCCYLVITFQNSLFEIYDVGAILFKNGHPQHSLTPLYKDNMSAINMINNSVPTERSCHIDIQHLAIQNWVNAKEIAMQHIPGIFSIPMDLPRHPAGFSTPAMGTVLQTEPDSMSERK